MEEDFPFSNPDFDSVFNHTIKVNNRHKPSQLLAWCSQKSNKIVITDLEAQQQYAYFEGVQLHAANSRYASRTHVKQIPNSNLLVSLHHSWDISANMEICDIAQNGCVRKVYSFGEVYGASGHGDITYNPRRGILGAMCVGEKIAYHLFWIDTYPSKMGSPARLCRKAKWNDITGEGLQGLEKRAISGLDLHLDGEAIAAITRESEFFISDVNTNKCNARIKINITDQYAPFNCCRWTTNSSDPFLFVNHDKGKLNIFDAVKKSFTMKNPVQVNLEYEVVTLIDVCPGDGRLLALAVYKEKIRISDIRESKIVKTFEGLYGNINCVRWSPNGENLATVSFDKALKLTDFTTGKVIHCDNFPENSK